MNAELPTSNWQHISEPIARLLKEKARQRGNASGHDRQSEKEHGDD